MLGDDRAPQVTNTATPATAEAARAGPREWWGLAVIALPCMVYAMDMTVLNLALPAIAAALRPSGAQLLWIVDIYGFMVAGFLVTMGTLGDRIGRRRLLLIGAAAFAVTSLLAAFASSAPALIVMRALLGIAGATLAPSTMSLIRTMFHDEHQRQFAIGVWIASFSFGAAIRPLVGGVLLQFFWWGSVFLVAVPVMALLLWLGPKLLPEYRDAQSARIDLQSVLLSLLAVLPVVYGLKRLAEHGRLDALALLSLIAGLAAGVIFVRRQRRLLTPLLDLALFRRPAFSAALATYGLSCMAMFGIYIFIAQFLQLGLQLSPLQAGLATMPWALAFIVGSLAAPRLARHLSPLQVLVGGMVVAAIGFAILACIGGTHSLVLLIVGAVIMSLGLAPVFTIGNEMIISSAPVERAGSASAMAETASEFGGALGIAWIGSVGMWVYRRELIASLPAELTADAHARSIAELATLGGALDVAASLPAGAAAALQQASRQAFVDALQASAVIGAVIVLLAGVMAARILRPGASPSSVAAASGKRP